MSMKTPWFVVKSGGFMEDMKIALNNLKDCLHSNGHNLRISTLRWI